MSYLADPIEQSIYLKPITEGEIEKEVEKLNTRKSISDIFNVNVIKMGKPQIIRGLLTIFNSSINEGTFPEMLEIAEVIPVRKKNDKFVTGNYRPISLLSVFRKCLEKLMYKTKIIFVKHDILYKCQYGLRTDHSTTHALVDVLEYIYNALDDGNYVIGVYVDIEKAFDSVSHDILPQELQHYGIRGLSLNWFSSCLHDRRQFVSVNGTNSDLQKLFPFGIP